MIKCKNDGCPKKKDICCQECSEINECSSSCHDNPNECDDAVFEGSTELEVFQSQAAAVIKSISDIVISKKALEDQEKEMKEQLKKAMEQHGIKSFKNDRIKMTYIDSTVRNSVDSAKLKKKYPDVAAECSKSSSVKAFVKVEVLE